MYLLDTNVLSEMRKYESGRIDRAVAAWVRSVAKEDLYLSVMTIIEIELGIAKLERHDAPQAALLRRWLREHVEPVFSDALLPLDLSIARRCGPLHVPDPRPERDAWIAATALEHDLIVTTRNGKDFAGTGVTIVNPWDHPLS